MGDRGLERRVDDAVGHAELRRRRGDVDHRTRSRLDHRRHERLTDEDRPVEVVLGQRPDVLERDAERIVGHGLAAGGADVAAGAIDQDVDRPELGLDVLSHFRHRRLVADVAGDRGDRAAVAGDLLGDGIEVGGLAILGRLGPGQVVDRDVRAELGQPFGHGAPEAAARSGDEGDSCRSSSLVMTSRSSSLSRDRSRAYWRRCAGSSPVRKPRSLRPRRAPTACESRRRPAAG